MSFLNDGVIDFIVDDDNDMLLYLITLHHQVINSLPFSLLRVFDNFWNNQLNQIFQIRFLTFLLEIVFVVLLCSLREIALSKVSNLSQYLEGAFIESQGFIRWFLQLTHIWVS